MRMGRITQKYIALKPTLIAILITSLILLTTGCKGEKGKEMPQIPESNSDFSVNRSRNLIQNGSFEMGLENWEGQTRISKELFKDLTLTQIQDPLQFPLNPYYLTNPIELSYDPKIFRGTRLMKSTTAFTFYNLEGKEKSVLTYVLNGTEDHWSYSNRVVDGISYVTIIRNSYTIGKKHKLEFRNILNDQNEGAIKFDGIALKKEDVGKIGVTLDVWNNPTGEMFITYKGWEKYANEELMDTKIEDITQIINVNDPEFEEKSAIYRHNHLPTEGGKYLEIKIPLPQELVLSQTIPLKQGGMYLFTANTKKRVGIDTPKVRVTNENNEDYFSKKINAHLAQSGWVQLGGAFKATGTSAVVKLYASNAGNETDRIDTEYYNYDNLQLTELPPEKEEDIGQVMEETYNTKLKKTEKQKIEMEPAIIDYEHLFPPNFKVELQKEYENLQIPIYDLYFDESKFYSGSLEEIIQKKVPATLKYKEQDYKVKIRIRGFTWLHFRTPIKSFRIESSSPSTFFGKKSMNLLRPATRDYIHEQYSNVIAKKLGLVVPEDELVFLRINNRPYGLMYQIEQWSEEMLEKQQKPVGEIFDDEVCPATVIYKKTDLACWESYIKDPTKQKKDKTNIGLLTHFMNLDYLEGFKKMIDINSLLKWNVHTMLIGSGHQEYTHNSRPYFNTTTGTFEFIPWDLKYRFRLPEDMRINPFMDFALKDLSIFNKRNEILWAYLNDYNSTEEDENYYADLYEKTEKAIFANDDFSWEEDVIQSDEEKKKFIMDIGKDIPAHREVLKGLLKSKTSLQVTLRQKGGITIMEGEKSLTVLEMEPKNDQMFSSAELQAITIHQDFLKQHSISLYQDNGDLSFNKESDTCIFSCETPPTKKIWEMNEVIPSKYHYKTYINTPPFNLSKINYKKIMDSNIVSEEDKREIEYQYEWNSASNTYTLWNLLYKTALDEAFKTIKYTPEYKKTTFYIISDIKNPTELLGNIQIKAINGISKETLDIEYKTQLIENPITLENIQIQDPQKTLELNLKYSDIPIVIQYHPEHFRGNMTKSTVNFNFFDNQGNKKSRLTYVLTGTGNHLDVNDTVVNGINYATIMKKGIQKDQLTEVTFPNILRDLNEKADERGGEAIKKENIGKITVQLETWFPENDPNATILVHYGGWEKYKKDYTAVPIITPTTEKEIFSHLEKEANNIDLTPYLSLSFQTGHREQFEKKYPFLLRGNESPNTYSFTIGIHKISETIIIPKDYTLIIKPGTTLQFAPKTSLIAYGKIKAVGTKEKPITFTSLLSRSWDVVGLAQENAGGEFEHCVFENGGDAHINGIYFSGMLSSYHANTSVRNCRFENAGKGGGDDALNFKNGTFIVENSTFLKNRFDAIDFDFAMEGSTIRNNIFIDNGNDGLDISGSNIELTNNQILRSGDKCMSVGENSKVTVINNTLENCNFGIVAKDSSQVIIIQNTILDNEVGIAAYNKKPLFEGGHISVYNTILKGNKQDFGIEVIEKNDDRYAFERYRSSGIIYNSKYTLSTVATKEIIKEPEKKTITKKQVLTDYLLGNLNKVGYKFATLMNQIEEGHEEDNPYKNRPMGTTKAYIIND